MGFWDFFKTRSLSSVLNQTHTLKVHGVKFTVRKLNPIDFLAGYKALLQPFDTYKTKSEKEQLEAMVQSTEKIKAHYRDVFMAAVISPKLVRKESEQDQGIWVDNLFTDWDLTTELVTKIHEITYGKKKMKLSNLPKIG